MKKYKIGIIGNGFVGQAIASAFTKTNPVKIYDKDDTRSSNSLLETVKESNVIFLCVPTPMKLKEDNRIDLSIIISLFKDIERLDINLKNKIFVIKSTVIPGTTRFLNKEFKKINIVFNPEFLTEKSARIDFINASRIILGGHAKITGVVERMYRQRFPYKKIILTDSDTAEFIKYICNSFFATKVSFMNEMYELATKLKMDWEKIIEGFISDGRIGNSHINVPGPDGSFGFGGKCFPKDINAMINFFEDNSVDPVILRATWQRNKIVRKNKDWESIDGATS